LEAKQDCRGLIRETYRKTENYHRPRRFTFMKRVTNESFLADAQVRRRYLLLALAALALAWVLLPVLSRG
jgi:hypothetical protein